MMELPLVAFRAHNSDAVGYQAVDVDRTVRLETIIVYELLLWDRNSCCLHPE